MSNRSVFDDNHRFMSNWVWWVKSWHSCDIRKSQNNGWNRREAEAFVIAHDSTITARLMVLYQGILNEFNCLI